MLGKQVHDVREQGRSFREHSVLSPRVSVAKLVLLNDCVRTRVCVCGYVCPFWKYFRHTLPLVCLCVCVVEHTVIAECERAVYRQRWVMMIQKRHIS